MGAWLSKVLDLLGLSKKEMRILMLGLDAVGKTTILYRLQLGKVVSVIPTIGFNVETVKYKRVLFTLWDIGNGDKFRPMWRHYYPNTQGVIFVVDSSDRDRVEEAKMELLKLSADDALGDAVLMVFANKQDFPNAMTAAELTDKLELHSITRRWNIQGTSATTGEGLYEGLEWLAANIAKKT